MRTKIGLLMTAFLLVTCQHETIENSGDWTENIDTHIDWIQNLNALISVYDNDAKMVSSKIVLVDGIETEIFMYNENSDGFSKIEAKSILNDEFPVNILIYLKDDVPVTMVFSGLGPYFNKGQTDENTKCCALFENVTYYKSKTEGMIFKRHVDLMYREEMAAHIEKLEALEFENAPIEYPEDKFKNVMRTVEDFKHKIEH